MAQQYYAEEITAVPFKVLAQSLSSVAPAVVAYPLAAFFRLRGMMNWPLQPMYATGELGSERIVERNELPARALSRLAFLFQQVDALGFVALKYAIADIIGEKEHVAAVFLDPAQMTLATLEWLRMRGANGLEEKTPYEFNSYGDQDPEIMTGAMNKEDLVLADMLTLSFVDTELQSNEVPFEQVYQRHQVRIRSRNFYQMTPEAARQEHEKRTARRFAWALEEGLMRPLRPREIERLRSKQFPQDEA
jgi:hypothetical protein